MRRRTRAFRQVSSKLTTRVRPLAECILLVMGLMIMSTSATASDADRAFGYEAPQLAYNMSGVTDWDPGMQFLNLVQLARSWHGNLNSFGDYTPEMLLEGGYLDEEGWPTSIPDELDAVRLFWAWDPESDAAEYRANTTYVLRYEGEGTLEVGGDAKVLSQEDGKIVFENTEGNFFAIKITETDPRKSGDYIRDISIVREEYVDLYDSGAIFNPDWLDLIKDSSQLRFMDWMDTNNSALSTWEDRGTPGSVIFNDVPLEYMVRLANEVGADPWFTIPHMADETYIRNFAAYVRDNLDPGLNVRVEYSNEAWNWSFDQTKWLLKQSQEKWGIDNGWNDYYVKMAVEAALIVEEVFAEAGAEGRLINVLGSQATNPGLSERLLSAEKWLEYEPENWVDPRSVFEELAITTYFGGFSVTKEELRAELLSAIEDPAVDASAYLFQKLMDPDYPGSVPYYAERWALQAEVAENAGLTLSAYEGGQHVHHTFSVKNLTQAQIESLTDFMQYFVKSEEMARLYEAAWDAWAAVTDSPFMQFGEIDDSSWRASFGLRTSYDDDSPRAVMLDELNEKASLEAGDGSATAYQHGIVAQGTEEAEVIVGTREEDYLIGKGGDDVFVAGKGDDGIHGGDGNDRVILSGSPGDYTLVAEGEGYRLTGPEGSDYLVQIETLSFENGVELSISEMLRQSVSEEPVEEGEVKTPAPAPEEDREASQEEPSDPSAPAGPEKAGEETNEPPDPAPVPAEEAEVEEPAQPESAVEAVFSGAGDLVEGAKSVKAEGENGVLIQALNRFSTVGRELGLNAEAGPAYAINVKGASATFDGGEVKASYYSLSENKAEAGGAELSGSALKTALKLGSIYIDVGTIIGSGANDRFQGRDQPDAFDGAAGNDYMAGAGGDDTFRGGVGDDKIFGGDDDDLALFSGTADDYMLEADGEGGYRISGLDGNDLLVDVERLGFDDDTILTIEEMLHRSAVEQEEASGAARKIGITDGAVEVLFSDTVGSENRVIDGAGEAVQVESSADMVIQGMNKFAALGKQIGEGAETGYVVYERGKAVEFDGEEVAANYWSIEDNTTTKGGEPLSGTVLETTLKFGSVALDARAITGGSGNDLFLGRNRNDIFFGGAGDDVLRGGGGNDQLAGGSGNDVLVGGAGNDLFVFAKGCGIDTIRDFSSGDALELGNFLEEWESPLDRLIEEGGHLTLDNGEDQIKFAGLTMEDASWVFG